MTSSLIHGVPNTSRAMCAVVTASLTVWQPAVLGSTRTPSSRMIDQKPWPAALAARLRGAATPSRPRLPTPGSPRPASRATDSARCRAAGARTARRRRTQHGQPPCIGASDLDASPSASSASARAGAATKLPFTAVATFGRRSPARPALAQGGGVERRALAVHDDLHPSPPGLVQSHRRPPVAPAPAPAGSRGDRGR